MIDIFTLEISNFENLLCLKSVLDLIWIMCDLIEIISNEKDLMIN